MDIRDGFLNIDKPAGWTSHDVVAKIRNLLRIKRVGHTGTLDPMATGVLPVCFGRGTKVAQYVTEGEKSYQAVMRLGESTDTQDASGRTVKKVDVFSLESNVIYEAVSGFIGRISQIPPMYSAVKIGGAPLYKKARLGEVVERKPRDVVIKDIKILAVEGRDVTLDIECSKGTYIRTLCFDIGERLGVGAHLLKLKRLKSGLFSIGEAVTIEQIEELIKDGNLCQVVYSVDKALSSFPILVVDEMVAKRIANGLPSIINDAGRDEPEPLSGINERYRVHDKRGRLVAIAYLGASDKQDSDLGSRKRLKIEKVLTL